MNWLSTDTVFTSHLSPLITISAVVSSRFPSSTQLKPIRVYRNICWKFKVGCNWNPPSGTQNGIVSPSDTFSLRRIWKSCFWSLLFPNKSNWYSRSSKFCSEGCCECRLIVPVSMSLGSKMDRSDCMIRLYEGRVNTWISGIWTFRSSAEFFRYVIPILHSADVCYFVMQRAISQYSIDPFLF